MASLLIRSFYLSLTFALLENPFAALNTDAPKVNLVLVQGYSVLTAMFADHLGIQRRLQNLHQSSNVKDFSNTLPQCGQFMIESFQNQLLNLLDFAKHRAGYKQPHHDVA